MLINELRLQNLQKVNGNYQTSVNTTAPKQKDNITESPFAKTLQAQIDKQNGVTFSKHALERVETREIDLEADNTLERLNKAVSLAQGKGSKESLIIVDSNAFVVNIQNNKVITTMNKQDMMENVFTNIDSTVIM